MLELRSVSWRNFMSYGDYETKVDLLDLGQCLITGEVIDDDSKEVYDGSNPTQIHRSNGAGKSTIPNVIQWALFGRTMHSASPGNNVVNWFTGRDCMARVEFKNGDSITRTRNTDGHNELIYVRGGDEVVLTADTVSVAKNQQLKLAKEFNLDWEIFCGSVFFNQYGKPWMEMADQSRKKAIERALHLDRFIYYSKVAKDRHNAAENQNERRRSELQLKEQERARVEAEITRLQDAYTNFSSNQKQRQKKMLEEALEEKEKRDAIELYDIEKLEKRWEIVKKIENILSEQEDSIDAIDTKIAETKGDINHCKKQIQNWEDKSGKVCVACEQPIPDSHVTTKTDDIRKRLDTAESKLQQFLNEKSQVQHVIASTRETLAAKKPAISVALARQNQNNWEQHDRTITRLKQNVQSIAAENNPHGESLAAATEQLKSIDGRIKQLQEDLERDDFLAQHYLYIHKAYNDRAKVKSYIFRDHIPFINDRLKHYLDVFGLDVQIGLTSTLGIQSNLWGYQFQSGGERKRTDVAFMLAMFDFHEEMYGRQCNVLVLDEVDGRLDDEGIDALINVIKNDLAPKVECILMISHRNMMYDTFPNELKVVRTNRSSQLVAV